MGLTDGHVSDSERTVELAEVNTMVVVVVAVEQAWGIWNLDARQIRPRFWYARRLSYTYVCVSKSALRYMYLSTNMGR